MELPSRPPGDQLLPSGQYVNLRNRLRNLAGKHDLRTAIICAFDPRTRLLPFHYSSLRIAPAGVRAIGSAMVDSGFERTRIVLQQWNRHVQPSRMKLDGAPIDLLLISSMRIHSAACEALLRDVQRIEPSRRPLVITGGPQMIYEPWTAFSADPNDPWGADAVVTGEEYVLMNLLEVLLSARSPGESLRTAFARARDRGWLDDVPGLVYPMEPTGPVRSLATTGVQRLVGDLDELPMSDIGYRLLEPPHRGRELASGPLEVERVHKYATVGTMVLTSGCHFACPYCPIPAYNQRQFRTKSPQRITQEMILLRTVFNIRFQFGTDDNFFAEPKRAIEICETLARTRIGDKSARKTLRWGTEVTVHDTLRMGEQLHLVRRAGAIAVWIGVEDMTGTLVKKGQTVDRTLEAMRLLRASGIYPVPMLMHHDGQPLITRKSHYGLINQVRLLRRAGAGDMQVLTLTPAAGSKIFEDTYTSGKVMASAAGRKVEPRMFDGNYVIASSHPRPWRLQMNVILFLMYYYNPLRLLKAIVWPRSRHYLIDSMVQVLGMHGQIRTLPRMAAWMVRLMIGPVRRQTKPPQSHLPLVSRTEMPVGYYQPDQPPAVQPATSRQTAQAKHS